MSVAIQKQIRDNAQSMQDYFKDLNEWTEDMAALESKRDMTKANGGVPPPKFVPPPRGQVETKKKDKDKKAATKAAKKEAPIKRDGTKIKDYYKQWDNFDVEAEEKKFEEPVKPRVPNPERFEKVTNSKPNLAIKVMAGARQKTATELAQAIKVEANNYFASARYREAIASYTSALQYVAPIASQPVTEDHPVDTEARSTAATLYCNRAMAHLKLSLFRQAIEDCDNALELEPSQDLLVKARFRRGNAFSKMKKWEQAKSDMEYALRIDPEDKKSKAELAYIIRMQTQETERRISHARRVISDKDRKPKLPLRRLQINVAHLASAPATEVEGSLTEEASMLEAEAESSSGADIPAKVKAGVVPAKNQAPRAPYVPRAVRLQRASAGRGASSAGPKAGEKFTFYHFERQWTQQTAEARLETLKRVGAPNMADVLRESLTTELLSEIVATLALCEDETFAHAVLSDLPNARRFSLSVGLLDVPERAMLDALLARVAPDLTLKYASELETLD